MMAQLRLALVAFWRRKKSRLPNAAPALRVRHGLQTMGFNSPENGKSDWDIVRQW